MSKEIVINKRIVIPASEIQFRFSRSSGPGGQNVNKLSTRAELVFNLAHSSAIDEPTKTRLLKKLSNSVDGAGTVTVTSQESRSQYQNKHIALEKFILMLQQALIVPKIRKDTKPTRSAKKKRLDSKNLRGAIKKTRTKHIDVE
jgi:ribosome-associated protein